MHLSTTFLAILSCTGAALAQNHWENKPSQNHWEHKPNQTWWEPKPKTTAAVVKGDTPPPQNPHWEHKPGQTWWGPKPNGTVKPHPHADASNDKRAVLEHENPWKYNKTGSGHGTVKHGWGHKPNATQGHRPQHWNGPPPHEKRGSQYGNQSPNGRGYATTKRRSRRNTGAS
ncbi:hypothetical protein HBI56_231680 [Parastagonospora nodorum]|nr:hypothetical protein HBH53_239140 [Parastagonospora nodorum]KAH3993586.1 hypothetical protein HBI10_200170 [Parastagonospora nodorum]KAH4012215.1 hypothetical protein HBI13_189980 [Parastagonospora nodorum]KAH4012351.1 hypothetical protein HBI09_222710 [Parastagonospora nodorum]KAH4043005.1 hypothetical protein HBH49_240510 [Parastagonospora nodorum]